MSHRTALRLFAFGMRHFESGQVLVSVPPTLRAAIGVQSDATRGAPSVVGPQCRRCSSPVCTDSSGAAEDFGGHVVWMCLVCAVLLGSRTEDMTPELVRNLPSEILRFTDSASCTSCSARAELPRYLHPYHIASEAVGYRSANGLARVRHEHADAQRVAATSDGCPHDSWQRKQRIRVCGQYLLNRLRCHGG